MVNSNKESNNIHTQGQRCSLLNRVSETISVKDARKILGTTATGMSDDGIRRLVAQTEMLTDIIIGRALGSKFKSDIDVLENEDHNG